MSMVYSTLVGRSGGSIAWCRSRIAWSRGRIAGGWGWVTWGGVARCWRGVSRSWSGVAGGRRWVSWSWCRVARSRGRVRWSWGRVRWSWGSVTWGLGDWYIVWWGRHYRFGGGWVVSVNGVSGHCRGCRMENGRRNRSFVCRCWSWSIWGSSIVGAPGWSRSALGEGQSHDTAQNENL